MMFNIDTKCQNKLEKMGTSLVQDQPWSFNGPYWSPKFDIMVFEKISGFFRKFRAFLYFTFSSPAYHDGLLIWSLRNSTKGKGTLLDLPGPQNGPKNGLCEANI